MEEAPFHGHQESEALLVDALMIAKEMASTIILSLADGNIGAFSAVARLIKSRSDAIIVCMLLDVANLRGLSLYVLWNDVFDRDPDAFADAIRGLSYNKLRDIRSALNGGDRDRAKQLRAELRGEPAVGS